MFKNSTKEEPTIFHAAAKMHKEGVQHLHVHVGSDRVEEFKKKLNDYNGKFDDKGNGYHFKSVTIHSAGARDPDAEGAEGMSATKMREAAVKGDKNTFRSGLHHNLTNADADDMMSKIKDRIGGSKNESFEIGDYVTDGHVKGEILSIHPKYAILVSEGQEHRVWTENLTWAESTTKRNQIYKESYIFKGYKTQNFNRTLAEEFKQIASTHEDEYAVLSCIKALDYVLGANDNTIAEDYSTVRVQTERLRRYSKKVGCSYLAERVISTVEEELLKYGILEDVKFSTTDRNMVAKVVGMVAGTSINNADPTNIVNQAVIKLRTQQLTPQG
jgi:hypothetical protein